jgi:hypothetical protein
MTRALAAQRAHWWGREPVQDWAYTAYVVDPETYRRVLVRIAAYWVGAFVGPVPPDAIAFISL